MRALMWFNFIWGTLGFFWAGLLLGRGEGAWIAVGNIAVSILLHGLVARYWMEGGN